MSRDLHAIVMSGVTGSVNVTQDDLSPGSPSIKWPYSSSHLRMDPNARVT